LLFLESSLLEVLTVVVILLTFSRRRIGTNDALDVGRGQVLGQSIDGIEMMRNGRAVHELVKLLDLYTIQSADPQVQSGLLNHYFRVWIPGFIRQLMCLEENLSSIPDDLKVDASAALELMAPAR
jgi:hypothetical protein